MVEHIRVLGRLGVARALLGIILGGFLIWKSRVLSEGHYGISPVTSDTLQLDRTAFLLIGAAFVVMAPVRALQGILALQRRPAARRFGLVLATIDVLNLALFPISTALGLYGIVVYRHPDVAGHFQSRQPQGVDTPPPLPS